MNWFWIRPPHIHFTVRSPEHSELTTQMYFAEEPLNYKDRLLQGHPKEEQEKCIVTFYQMNQKRMGQFNLTLNKLRKTFPKL